MAKKVAVKKVAVKKVEPIEKKAEVKIIKPASAPDERLPLKNKPKNKFDVSNILNKSDVKQEMSNILKRAVEIIGKLSDADSKTTASHNLANIKNYRDESINEHNTLEQDISFILKANEQLEFIKNINS